MKQNWIVVVEVLSDGSNQHHVISEAQHAAWRDDEGSTGQDRESYSDDQDREGYSTSTEDGLAAFAYENGETFDAWAPAAAHVASLGGTIIDVIAAVGEDG